MLILLQINHISSDEPEIVYEGYYEIKDTSIFSWSLIARVEHDHWLHGSIHRLPPNSQADYLIHIILHIVDFLRL